MHSDADAARDQFAPGIAKRHREIMRVAHDQRAGRTRQGGRHFVGDGAEAVLDELQRRRINGTLSRNARRVRQGDNDVTEAVAHCGTGRRHQDRRVEILDDGRAAYLAAADRTPLHNPGIMPAELRAEIGATCCLLPFGRTTGGLAADISVVELAHAAASGGAKADQLHARSILLIAIGALVIAGERVGHHTDRSDIQGAWRYRHDHLIGLTEILHRCRTFDLDVAGRKAFLLEVGGDILF